MHDLLLVFAVSNLSKKKKGSKKETPAAVAEAPITSEEEVKQREIQQAVAEALAAAAAVDRVDSWVNTEEYPCQPCEEKQVKLQALEESKDKAMRDARCATPTVCQ